MKLSPEMSLNMEQRQESPYALWDRLDVFAGTEYGCSDKELFRARIMDRMKKKPLRPQVLIASALPASGKSTVLDELSRSIYKGKNRSERHRSISSFARRKGYRPKRSVIDWGAPFNHIPPDLRVTGVDYHSADMYDFRLRKQREIQIAAHIFAEGLKYSIMKYDERPSEVLGIQTPTFAVEPDDKVMRLIVGDHPGPTGEGDYGIDRGTYELRELATHTGRFEGLDYDVWWIGMVAQPQVRDYCMENRALMGEVSGSHDVTAIRDRGILVNPHDEEQFENYISEAAPIDEIVLLEEDVREFIEKRWAEGLRLPTWEYSHQVPLSFEDTHREAKATYMGQLILPDYYQRGLQVPDPESVIIFNNAEIVKDGIRIPEAVNRPLEDIVPYIDFTDLLT